MHERMLACLVALGAASCVSATTAPPVHRQAQIGALAAVRSAETVVEENQTPGAQERLRLAKHDFRKGRTLAARGEAEVARLYFERSQANAEVAIARARAKEAQDKVARAETGAIEEMERPIQRERMQPPEQPEDPELEVEVDEEEIEIEEGGSGR